MTVAELIKKLSKFDSSAEVAGTWEGVIREVSVYRAKDGTVLIDVDGEFYREDFESGRVSLADRQ